MFKTADEARKYIEQTTKAPVKDSPIELTKRGEIKVDKHTKNTINHTDLANAMIKYIAITPGINPLSRKIMTSKIINPGMTNLTFALKFGMREEEVRLYEVEGKMRVMGFLNRISSQDAINKFNTERTIQNEVKNLNIIKNNPLMEANPT